MSSILNLDRNTLAGFLAIVLWSGTVALVGSILEQVGPITATAAVYLTGGLLLSCNKRDCFGFVSFGLPWRLTWGL